jgi:hypothetical protein
MALPYLRNRVVDQTILNVELLNGQRMRGVITA